MNRAHDVAGPRSTVAPFGRSPRVPPVRERERRLGDLVQVMCHSAPICPCAMGSSRPSAGLVPRPALLASFLLGFPSFFVFRRLVHLPVPLFGRLIALTRGRGHRAGGPGWGPPYCLRVKTGALSGTCVRPASGAARVYAPAVQPCVGGVADVRFSRGCAESRGRGSVLVGRCLMSAHSVGWCGVVVFGRACRRGSYRARALGPCVPCVRMGLRSS
ncbi:hypothetical protein B0H17DRAFT_1096748 [Mycena rosella]|uniref:Uncharacterized protein n=1 Tax=Mycena rosella TaxID=1033263 RepID=A0AAD7G299_MYCRO|nr:hypothetical protein B0H17DRAFT_1096748 [Mycena rosella]